MFEIVKLIISALSLLFEIIKFVYKEHLLNKIKKYISEKKNHNEKK